MKYEKKLRKLEKSKDKYFASKSFYEIVKAHLMMQKIECIEDFLLKYPFNFPVAGEHEGDEWIQSIFWAFEQEMLRVDEKAKNGVMFFDNQKILEIDNGFICETTRDFMYKNEMNEFCPLFPPYSKMGTSPVKEFKESPEGTKERYKEMFANNRDFGLLYSEHLPILSCLFPERVCVVPADIMVVSKVSVESTEYKMNICNLLGLDIFRRVIMYEELFENNLIYAYPHLVICDDDTVEIKYTDSNNICYMEGFGYSSQKKGKQISFDNLFIELPWLKGIHIEDFLELRDKYNTEFLRYQLKMEELLLNSTVSCTFENLLVKEYNEASLEIRNIMINKKEDLKRIGKNALLGTILTAIPTVLEKNNFAYFDPSVLSGVVGGCTLFNSYSDFLKISKLERNNPYWLLWKLEQSSK